MTIAHHVSDRRNPPDGPYRRSLRGTGPPTTSVVIEEAERRIRGFPKRGWPIANQRVAGFMNFVWLSRSDIHVLELFWREKTWAHADPRRFSSLEAISFRFPVL